MSERPHRLLQIHNCTLGGGGEEETTRQIARVLGGESTRFEDCSFRSADWTGPNAPPVWKQAVWMFHNPNSLRLIREAHERIQAQAWVLHNFVPVVSAEVYREARRLGVPVIQYIHNFRPFSVSSYLWAGRPLDPASWRMNFAREIGCAAWRHSRLRTAWLALVLATMHCRGDFRTVSGWIAMSDFMRQKFIRSGIAAERIFRLPFPYYLRLQSPNLEEGGHYLFLGRLIEEKGVHVLLRAWELIRDMHLTHPPKLVIGGDGPLAAEVRSAAAANPLLDFRGFVSGASKDSMLEGCRAVIVPSVWWEPLGIVVFEAYDFAKPVLAAKSGGLGELIEHGLTGMHHSPGDAAQLAHQVAELDSDAGRRRTMGQQGRAWLLANTGDNAWKNRFHEIVESVIHGTA
jgi:glycosyltransferase involved in cell wall biosynthesis